MKIGSLSSWTPGFLPKAGALLFLVLLMGYGQRPVLAALDVVFPPEVSSVLLSGGFSLGLGVILILLVPRKHCPVCNAVLPRFIRPSTFSQAWWGGCTCRQCHTALDSRLRVVSDDRRP